MGIDKLFSSLQEETDRMADAVDKVFDDTDRALKGVDASNLTKEQEDALEHQIEKEVADSIQGSTPRSTDPPSPLSWI